MRAALGALGLGAAAAALTVTPAVLRADPAHADTVICEKYGSTSIQGGRYIVQNNVWGTDAPQCITVTSTGFAITQANHDKPTNGAPASYPSAFYGCHYANCTSGTILPLAVSDPRFAGITTSATMTYPGSGQWNASYDIWFDPTPRTDGQNTGAEIMVWVNRAGAPQPVGSRIATVNLAGATWDVWFGNIGWNVVSYVRTAGTGSISFAPAAFYDDAVARGYAQRSWYLTSIQAGFEPWTGGQGLAVTNFSVTTGGGPNDTTPPSVPAGLTASNITASSATLSWQPATDNVGVTGYDVYRVQNGQSTAVGTAAGTSFAAGGLSPSTTYGFFVRARDAAGNLSPASGTVTVRTLSGGGGPTACSVRYVKYDWGGGFTAEVTITNTGAATIEGWTLAFGFAGDQRVTNAWNATVNQSGAAVTARSLAYNGVLTSGASTSFGFQAGYSGSNTDPAGFALNGAACS